LVNAFDWPSIAWLMGIPREHHGNFIWWVLTDIKAEWRHAMQPPAPTTASPTEIDADIARAARALIRALEQRDEFVDRKMAKVTASYLEHVKAPTLGRRKSASRFGRFVEYLLYVTYALGGKANINRKAERGNIIELLDDLRPMMPPGFIPKGLALHTLERLCAQARDFGRSCSASPGFAKNVVHFIGDRPRFRHDTEITMAVGSVEARHIDPRRSANGHSQFVIAFVHSGKVKVTLEGECAQRELDRSGLPA
jgi:hypothetical protein